MEVMPRQAILWAIVAAIFASIAAAQVAAGPPGAAPPPTAAAAATAPAATASAPARLLRLDRQKRQVVIEAVVSQPQGQLEFLLCLEGTKDYEAMLTTKVPPSAVHAALLALNLMPGKPARWQAPPGKPPAFMPPTGANLEVSFRYNDKDGKARQAPAAQWLLAGQKKKTPDLAHFVFDGSDILDDGRYWADVEGGIISLANFASSVIDVPFQSTDKNAFLEFVADGGKVPPAGTAVQVVLTAAQGAEAAEVARISLTVDSLGRIRLDGQALAPEAVGEQVKALLGRHTQLSADIRLDPQALVHDRERLKVILEDAGVTDLSFRVVQSNDDVLPRTPEEAARTLAWWKQQLANARELIVDPFEDAQRVIQQVQRQRRQLDDTRGLWAQYAEQLARLVREQQAATQPATAPAAAPGAVPGTATPAPGAMPLRAPLAEGHVHVPGPISP